MRSAMNLHRTSRSRCAATSVTQREVIHAHGHTGSQKNSTSTMTRTLPSGHPRAVTRIAVTTIIDAPPDAVWHVVEPLERRVDWMADAVAIRFVGEQTRGAGARFDCDTKVGPITLTDRMEITEWDPGRAMGVRHSGVVTGTGRFTLERAGARGTVFSWEEELRFPWWL